MRFDNITLNEDKTLWFVSDTHFNHRKLVTGCPEHFERCRTYETTDEMNKDIIEKWNENIKPIDYVIFMGDFLMGTPARELLDYFTVTNNKLSGIKYYIRGNHDSILVDKTKDFVQWHNGLVFDYRGKHYICQHHDYNEVPIVDKVLKINDNDYSMNVLVHGHTHNTEKVSIYDAATTWKMKQNNVCWEAWYRPAIYTELVNISGESNV